MHNNIRSFCIVLTFVLFLINKVYPQAPSSQWTQQQTTWQQTVDVKISVTLDPHRKMLMAQETIEYTNHAPDALQEIWFHIWPNAYSQRNTPFAKHFLENGSLKFHVAPDSCRGFMDSLKFTVNGQDAKWETGTSPDIVRLVLPSPLLSGNTCIIQTPFRVKIPCMYSRMGYENTVFCITQWYPKPAVYDLRGWNTMPYLDQGEFYSEFGKTDISISIPENYVVAASGLMQNEDEKERLARNSPKTGSNLKTLRYILKNTHDFAWFASPNFHYACDTFYLDHGQQILLQSFLDNRGKNLKDEHEKILADIKATLEFRNAYIGAYSWPVVTVVQGPLISGGGMEYPTITVIPKPYRGVIEHEVGHNWFYGMLGSDERKFPWMDEGLNTFYDVRFNLQNPSISPQFHDYFPLSLTGMKNLGLSENSALLPILSGNNQVQSATDPAEMFEKLKYGSMVYGHSSRAFFMLKDYLGAQLFDSLMRGYFEAWKFRHPLPGDFKTFFEQGSGKNLGWFFSEVLSCDYPGDIGIRSVQATPQQEGYLYRMKIIRKGYPNTPIPLSYTRDSLYFLEPGQSEIYLAGPLKQWQIDPLHYILEKKNSNNLQKRPFRLKLLYGLGQPDERVLGYAPLLGYNAISGWMPGLFLTQELVPARRAYFRLAVLYGTKDQTWNGMADAGIRVFYHRELTEVLQLGAQIKRYQWFENAGESLHFLQWEPYLQINIRPTSHRSPFKKTLTLRGIFSETAEPDFRSAQKRSIQRQQFALLRFHKSSIKASYPWDIKADFIISNAFNQFSLTWKGTVYVTEKYPLQFRLFGAAMAPDRFVNTVNGRYFLNAMVDGYRDYLFEETYLHRTGLYSGNTHGIARQIMERDGFMKIVMPLAASDRWLTALNLEMPIIPKFKGLNLYGDLCWLYNTVYNASTRSIDRTPLMLYSGGLSLHLVKNRFVIYLPLVHAPLIKNAYRLNDLNLGETIMFKMTIKAPINERIMKLLENISQ